MDTTLRVQEKLTEGTAGPAKEGAEVTGNATGKATGNGAGKETGNAAGKETGNATGKEAGKAAGKPTGMMCQYWDIKSQFPDALLFFRVGDFYETFDTDAQVAARELDITLTGRPESSHPAGRVPMAGVPVRSYEMYVAKLLAKGYSVAICEQVGEVGASKGPVERQVRRILTPGTVLESHPCPVVTAIIWRLSSNLLKLSLEPMMSGGWLLSTPHAANISSPSSLRKI